MEGGIREYAKKATVKVKVEREEEERAAAVLADFATEKRKRAGKRRGASRKVDAVSAVPPPPAGDVFAAFPVEPAPTSLQEEEADVVAALNKLMQGEASCEKNSKAAEAVVDTTRPRHAVSPPPPAPVPAGGSHLEPVFCPVPLAIRFPPRGFHFHHAPAPAAPAAERVVPAAPSPPAPAPAGNTFAYQFAPVSFTAPPLAFSYYFPHAMMAPPPVFNRAPAPASPAATPQTTWDLEYHQRIAALTRSQLQARHYLSTLRPLLFAAQHQPAPTVSNAGQQPFYQPPVATAATNTSAFQFQPYTAPGTFTAPQPGGAPSTSSGGGLPYPPTIHGVRDFVTGGGSTTTDANASSSAAPVLSPAHLQLYRLLEVQAAGGLGAVHVDDPGKQDGRRRKKRRGGA